MQRVYIVTDTVAQLTEDIIGKQWIKVVPAATIYCDGKTYIDGVDISPAQAYQLLAQNPSQFTTAAIPPDYFGKTFEEVSNAAREILCITVSSKLSAGHDMALMASKQVQETAPELKIRVFDSLSAAGVEGLIVLAAARAAAAGQDLDGVAKVAERTREVAEGLFVFETMRDVHRSGRIPKVVSQAADKMGVKPICRIYQDGKVHFTGLARSRNKGVQRVLEMARERVGDTPIQVIVMHTAAPDDAEKLKKRVEAEFHCLDIFVSEFSPVMGYSTGPGILGIAFCPEIDIAEQET